MKIDDENIQFIYLILVANTSTYIKYFLILIMAIFLFKNVTLIIFFNKLIVFVVLNNYFARYFHLHNQHAIKPINSNWLICFYNINNYF